MSRSTGRREPYVTVARVRSGFPSKFGVPRQAGMVPELESRVVFEPEFRSLDALRGLEGFSHLWLVWEFDLSVRSGWSPTVRPPRLRGRRLGVFATRSPFRPNPIGLSSVELVGIDEDDPEGPVLVVRGADLVDQTPVLDIKPYIPLDSHPNATSGFIAEFPEPEVSVLIGDELLPRVPEELRDALRGVLAHDPRPVHLHDPGREFGLPFAGLDVRFRFDGRDLVVTDVTPLAPDDEARWPGYRG